MANLQVKDVPPPMHEELRRRARERGISVRDYLLDLLRRDQAVPSKIEWAAAVDRLRPITLEAPVAEQLRHERDRRLGSSEQ